jgi:hypothetical protein
VEAGKRKKLAELAREMGQEHDQRGTITHLKPGNLAKITYSKTFLVGWNASNSP